MVEVICDTSFLIHLSTHKIKNIDSVNTEIGQIQFVVPIVVWNELVALSIQTRDTPSRKKNLKKQDVWKTINYAEKLKIIPMSGTYADAEITKHVKKHGGIVGTMDKELKRKIKGVGGSIMSFSKNKIVLES